MIESRPWVKMLGSTWWPVVVVWVTVVILGFLDSCAHSQEIWWTRYIDGDRPQCWVYGRDFQYPINGQSDSRYSPSATIEPQTSSSPLTYGPAITLEWDTLAGANAAGGLRDDPHRATDRLLRFWLPATVADGVHRLTVRRADGPTCQGVLIVSRRPRFEVRSTHGEYREWSQAVIVGSGQTLDLGGATVVIPSAITLSAERAAVVLSSGSRLTNGTIIVPEGCRADLRSVVGARGKLIGTQIDAVRIEDRRPYGLAFWGGDELVQSCLFSDMEVVADTSFEANLWCESNRNTWYRVAMSSPRGWRSGGCGRLAGGSENLLVWATVEGKDRAWTIGPWGSPVYRSVWFECDQHHTGQTVGASEGTVLETCEAAYGIGLCAGTNVTYVCHAETPENIRVRICRPGMFATSMVGNSWARVVSASWAGQVLTMTTDRPLGDGWRGLRVGNAVTQCLFDRGRYEDGRSAIWLYGESVENDICQCHFQDLKEPAIQELNRPVGVQGNWFGGRGIGNVLRFNDAVRATELMVRP
ncbi:MAG: hypothetical protein EB060_10285 [Proteobacteria bacterium]|nr:hypothetical protein [Pseudomonadota bacterium]